MMAQEPDQKEEQDRLEVREFDDALDTLVELAKAVDEAFPNLKCLRCESEGFLLVDTGVEWFGDKVVDLVCQRCGMVERHSWKILKKAAKPIITD